jgi:hypothetical protein
MSVCCSPDRHGTWAPRVSPSSLHNCGMTDIRQEEVPTTPRAIAVVEHREFEEPNASGGYRESHTCESEATR